MEAKSSAPRAIIVTPDQALPIKPFGLDMKVLLTAEATGGAQLGHRSTRQSPTEKATSPLKIILSFTDLAKTTRRRIDFTGRGEQPGRKGHPRR